MDRLNTDVQMNTEQNYAINWIFFKSPVKLKGHTSSFAEDCLKYSKAYIFNFQPAFKCSKFNKFRK